MSGIPGDTNCTIPQYKMKINIQIDDSKVRQAFSRLRAASHDTSPAMRAIGEIVLASTRERFRTETTPDGSPWADTTPATKRRKSRNTNRILTHRGYLSGQLTIRHGRNWVDIGSNRIYASTHQFGARKGAFGTTKSDRPIPWGNIPARPFLGLSPEDHSAIQDLLADYISDKWHPRYALPRKGGVMMLRHLRW